MVVRNDSMFNVAIWSSWESGDYCPRSCVGRLYRNCIYGECEGSHRMEGECTGDACQVMTTVPPNLTNPPGMNENQTMNCSLYF